MFKKLFHRESIETPEKLLPPKPKLEEDPNKGKHLCHFGSKSYMLSPEEAILRRSQIDKDKKLDIKTWKNIKFNLGERFIVQELEDIGGIYSFKFIIKVTGTTRSKQLIKFTSEKQRAYVHNQIYFESGYDWISPKYLKETYKLIDVINEQSL